MHPPQQSNIFLMWVQQNSSFKYANCNAVRLQASTASTAELRRRYLGKVYYWVVLLKTEHLFKVNIFDLPESFFTYTIRKIRKHVYQDLAEKNNIFSSNFLKFEKNQKFPKVPSVCESISPAVVIRLTSCLLYKSL